MIAFKVRFSNGTISPVDEVPEDSTVEQVKFILHDRNLSPVPPDQQRLIFKGRILANETTLVSAGVVEGSILHFVKASKPSPAADSQPPPAPPVAAAPAAPGGGLFNTAGGLQLPPDAMLNMLTNFPPIRNMMEQNPRLAEMLNSPEGLAQLQQMANPAMRDQIMRNQDRQLANIDLMPGGQAALQRALDEVSEVDNLFDARPTPPTVTRNTPQLPGGGPENSPMPNPWGGNRANNNAATNTNYNPWAAMAPTNRNVLPVPPPPSFGEGFPNMNMFPPEVQRQALEMMGNPEAMRAMQQQMQQMEATLGPERVQELRQQIWQQTLGGQQPLPDFASSLFSGGEFGNRQGGAGLPNPETRFANELGQLESMGFTDRAKNIRALVSTNGNVNAAVERLLLQ